MKKTFKVVMLPTKPIKQEDITREGHFHEGLLLQKEKLYLEGTLTYLYIISDDEIKEGDWQIDSKNRISKFTTASMNLLGESYKKIVATTDESLQVILDCEKESTFSASYPTQLPQIPESFIQAFIKAYNEGKPITEVDLELEPNESKGCFTIKTRSDNTVIVHQSKMYSREEVIELTKNSFRYGAEYGYGKSYAKTGFGYPNYEGSRIKACDKWIQDNL